MRQDLLAAGSTGLLVDFMFNSADLLFCANHFSDEATDIKKDLVNF